MDELGDGPAKAIIERNRKARLARNSKETQEELSKISCRVEEVSLLIEI